MESLLSGLTFRGAIVAFPIAVALHVFEEWPGFPEWARRFASPAYSDREYVTIHVVAIVSAALTAALLRAYPKPWLVFAFFAFVFLPGVLCNAGFHAAASVWSGRYCPGVATGLLLYVPYACLLAGLALREGILPLPALLVALALAVPFHALEVGHNVFKRW